MNLQLRRWLRAGACIVGMSCLLAAGALVIAGLSDRLDPADAALVLGNKVELDGTPSARLRARLDRTVELYRQGRFPRVIASGGVGKEGFDEAAVMRGYLVAHGIPADRIVVDSQGVNSWASAQFAAEFLRREHLRSIFVISQYYHVPRTRLALRRVGVSDVSYAHARFFELRDLYSVPRELAGLIKYALRKAPPPAESDAVAPRAALNSLWNNPPVAPTFRAL